MKVVVVVLGLLLSVNSFGSSYRVTRVSGTHTIVASEQVTIVSGSTEFDLTLPACSTSNDGEYHIVKYVGSSDVQVLPNGSDTVEGSNGYSFFRSQSATLTCDGNNHDWLGVAVY